MAAFLIYAEIDFKEKNVLTYLSGYILKKITNKICSGCLNVIDGSVDSTSEHQSFLNIKQYKTSSGNLKIPSNFFVLILEEFEDIYRCTIDKLIHEFDLRKKMVSELYTSYSFKYIRCQNCKIQNYITDIYLNVRINHTLREFNRSILDRQNKKNRKIIKFSHL